MRARNTGTSDPVRRFGPVNRLLAALPAAELDVLRPDLEAVPLTPPGLIHEPDEPIAFVLFPHAGVVSLVRTMEDGGIAEVATVGPEGMVGLPLVLDGDRMAVRAHVQVPGTASRMGADAFRRALGHTPCLRRLLSRYALAFVDDLAGNVACGRMHEAGPRLARWLLATADRVGAESFPLTQEFMAQMLGVSRPTVSIAAGLLQRAGLVTYMRGRITVTDRPGLEAASCECYRVARRAFARVADEKG